MPNLFAFIALILTVLLIVFWPIIFKKENVTFLDEKNTKKEKLLEILRDIELEYELGNINLETYQRSKSDYANDLKNIIG